jgi:1-acyl-sn-glycerol-3-phosphate acyltransferase
MDGRLRPFKRGAFELAVRQGVPVLPIVVEGTGDALPKAGLMLNSGRHDIRIRVLPEISPESFADLSAEQLADDVRELFKRELGQDD